MKLLNPKIRQKFAESLKAVLPVVGIVIVLSFTIAPITSSILLCFLVGAVCMPDRGEMLSGLWKILASTCKISTNYFALGGYAATFLNMALLGFVLTGLYHFLKAPVNNVSTLAFVLTLGFGSWGINVLNLWFSVLGVVLYANCLSFSSKN